MSKAKPDKNEEVRNEYDFDALAGGIRGKHVRQYRAGTNLALLDADVAKAFPTDEAVNTALRVVLKAASAIRMTRTTDKSPLRVGGAEKISDKPRTRRRTVSG